MDTDEQIVTNALAGAQPAEVPSAPSSDDPFGDLMKERKMFRKIIFYFSMILVSVSCVFVFKLILMQIKARYEGVVIFESGDLKVIVTGVFVQILGLLFIITRALWNDKDYLSLIKR